MSSQAQTVDEKFTCRAVPPGTLTCGTSVPLSRPGRKCEGMLRVAFDIGGVLSKYREIQTLASVLQELPGVEVFVLTDMPHAKAMQMLNVNGALFGPHHVVSCDYDKFGEGCKAEVCRELQIDILLDDFVGYVSMPGAPPVRLLVMPDAMRPYYHPAWEVDADADAGKFGHATAPDEVAELKAENARLKAELASRAGQV